MLVNLTAHGSTFLRWDFPLLAMSAARIGEQEKAVEWLLHPLFRFDDVGMPVGGVRRVCINIFAVSISKLRAGFRRHTFRAPAACYTRLR